MKLFISQILLSFFVLFTTSSDWITYTSKDNTFKVMFPGQPQEMNMKPGYGIDSTQIFQYFLIDKSNPDGGAVFTLTIQTLSEEILKPNLNQEQRYQVMKKYSTTTIGLIGEVIKTEKISLSDIPGIFITGRISQAINDEDYPSIWVKSYLVKNKLYILKATCSPKTGERSLPDKFFDSFEILK